MRKREFGIGFFGRNLFDKKARNIFQTKWAKMTDNERLDFMNKREERTRQDFFSVEAIDARCGEWMKKNTGEKEAFIKERREARAERFSSDFCRHGFGFEIM